EDNFVTFDEAIRDASKFAAKRIFRIGSKWGTYLIPIPKLFTVMEIQDKEEQLCHFFDKDLLYYVDPQILLGKDQEVRQFVF
ncbi:MAG: hypothetical protein HUU50_20345, partial [Candidatus Brocadiae bacterium]|nr:hypothetical protein [Candidatus Brocadiia bacterium]